jgi:hypothetical protein
MVLGMSKHPHVSTALVSSYSDGDIMNYCLNLSIFFLPATPLVVFVLQLLQIPCPPECFLEGARFLGYLWHLARDGLVVEPTLVTLV